MPVCGRCAEDNPARARFCLACAAPLVEPAARDERKVVSVLFCDLVGFTSRAEHLDVEDVRGLLRPFYARVRRELERFGGTVEKFIGDAVMALFGAPVAHEDDPERAVRAALAIREAIAELNERDPSLDLHVRVGVTSGEALVALDARPSEGEGMAAGDVVNSAARLQAAAPVDGILVDRATYRATDRRIAYQDAEPVTVKGRSGVVQVWLAIGPRASLGVDVAGTPRTALVGRERELAQVRQALAEVRAERRPRLVTVAGVPGIGKSRLLAELLATVEAEPELTIWRQGRCLPYGEGVALWALGEVVKAQAGILETDAGAQAEAKLTRMVADLLADAAEADWVTGHIRPLVGLGGVGQAGGDRRDEAFAAWRRLLEALAEQAPAVLVIEDLHWADEVLLDFLEHLADWSADVPLLLLVTTRPELLDRRPWWARGGPNRAVVQLAPLGERDTARLVELLLDQPMVPEELRSALLARAGGIPLYAEEYVRMLLDRGLLRRSGRTGRLEQTGELPLPQTVQGIIAARLDALEAPDKALLADAAVLGKVAWVGALAALGEAQPAAVEQRLVALERTQLLRSERRSQVAGERQYAFRHALIRDVAYGQLPRSARARKHRLAAQWLQSLSPDRAVDRAELLAHHWHEALGFATAAGQDTTGLADHARLALRDAGDRSLDLNAFAAAVRWYSAALRLWPEDDPERSGLLLRLGQARFQAEEAGDDELTAARDLLLGQGELETAADAERLLGSLAMAQGRGEDCVGHARRAVALLEGAPPSRTRVTVLASLAGALMIAGGHAEAIEVGREAVTMADALGLDDQRARALNFIGCARLNDGDAAGIGDLERAVAIAVRVNSPDAALLFGNMATAATALGDLPRAFELQASATQVAERFGLAGDLRWLRAEHTFQDYWQGNWDAALDGVQRLLAETEAGAPHFMEDDCRCLRGLIRLARGDLQGALSDAASAVELAEQARDPGHLQPALAFHARALLAAGRADEAAARVEELLAALAEQSALPTGDWAGLGLVLHTVGRAAELERLAAATADPSLWLLAAAAMAAGDFQRAADHYERIGSLPDEAVARLRAAAYLLAAGQATEANAQLERASAFFARVRADAYLREADALLAPSA
jgi:class 3 adenylate cyclase/tetratricopeptide (TPR) repeat protein